MTIYAHRTIQTKLPPVRPPNGMLSAETAHLSQGGRPWPIEVRNMVVSMHLNGDDFNNASLARLREQYKFPSTRTIFCWLQRFNDKGTALPNRATGNRHSTQQVNGVDLVNLALV